MHSEHERGQHVDIALGLGSTLPPPRTRQAESQA